MIFAVSVGMKKKMLTVADIFYPPPFFLRINSPGCERRTYSTGICSL